MTESPSSTIADLRCRCPAGASLQRFTAGATAAVNLCRESSAATALQWILEGIRCRGFAAAEDPLAEDSLQAAEVPCSCQDPNNLQNQGDAPCYATVPGPILHPCCRGCSAAKTLQVCGWKTGGEGGTRAQGRTDADLGRAGGGSRSLFAPVSPRRPPLIRRDASRLATVTLVTSTLPSHSALPPGGQLLG